MPSEEIVRLAEVDFTLRFFHLGSTLPSVSSTPGREAATGIRDAINQKVTIAYRSRLKPHEAAAKQVGMGWYQMVSAIICMNANDSLFMSFQDVSSTCFDVCLMMSPFRSQELGLLSAHMVTYN